MISLQTKKMLFLVCNDIIKKIYRNEFFNQIFTHYELSHFEVTLQIQVDIPQCPLACFHIYLLIMSDMTGKVHTNILGKITINKILKKLTC